MHRGRFRKLPVRRSVGSISKCVCSVDAGLSATGFTRPAESVVSAFQRGIFLPNSTYLEVGGGNLRNAIFVQHECHPKRMTVVEQPSVVSRFRSNYDAFLKSGGMVTEALPNGRFDVIVVTYVLETICPQRDRENLLVSISNHMHNRSRLILSVRGYPGVRGKYYKRCPHSDGWVSARGAFVRAYSISEIEDMLGRHNLEFEPLQRYRVDNPENIHGIAKIQKN
jgi:hypothetical protein